MKRIMIAALALLTVPMIWCGKCQAKQNPIGDDAAKGAALIHAGVNADQVLLIKCEPDREDGRQIYEVEFYTADGREYEYDLDAYTGAVLSYEMECKGAPAAGDNASVISADAAKAAALAKVPGASVNHIVKFKTDYDDGRLEYEGKIIYKEMKYKFEIDAYSGAIREWKVESIYD